MDVASECKEIQQIPFQNIDLHRNNVENLESLFSLALLVEPASCKSVPHNAFLPQANVAWGYSLAKYLLIYV